MSQSIAQIQTSHASRYLRQLCKHFSHKVPAEFDDRQGSITFAFGTCALLAQQGALTVTVAGDDPDKLEHVVGSHLERFAFRESLNVTWVRTPKP